jgi:hypothetical protein
MNSDNIYKKSGVGAYILAFLGTFLIVALLVHFMQFYTRGPSVAGVRSAERLQIMAEFKALNNPLVEKYDWQDQPKGFVRVPLERAKELVLQEWQNPEAARSNLMARAAIEYAPAPKPPEKKSVYE